MSEPSVNDRWDPALYEKQHDFVHKLAGGVVELLDPQPDERILDVGCGTGSLTAKIAAAGAIVIGIDASPAMIANARQRFPALQFKIQDATAMQFDAAFDAVFSNAALHWIKPPELAAQRIYQSLKPRGRFVCEFGGKGNVARVLDAAVIAGKQIGLNLETHAHINYFPSPGEYAMLLERQGFEVTFMHLFDRPTPLEGAEGLRNWIRMFRPGILEAVPTEKRDLFFSKIESVAHPHLFRENRWLADYRRLRIIAHHA